MPTSLTLENTTERPEQNRVQILALASLVAVVVFVLDVFLPLGVAEAVPYVAVVLIVLRSPEKEDPIRAAVGCSLLTLLGYFVSPSGVEAWIGVANRSIAMFAIWTTALLAMQVKQSDAATRDQSAMLTGILSNMPAVAFRLGHEGVMRESFGHGLTRLGFKELSSIGRIPLEPPAYIKKQIQEGTLPSPYFYEANGICEGESWWFLNCLCQIEDGRQDLIGFGIDITDRKRAERGLAAHDAVSDILSRSTNTVEEYLEILQALGATLTWSVGILWTMDHQRSVFRATAMWPPDSPQTVAMAHQQEGNALVPDVGLVGYVWDANKPMWIEDLVEWPKDPRSSVAAEYGLHSAVALPIRVGGQGHAVLEFFSSSPEQPDDALLQMLTNICFQIGQSIERENKERRLAAHHTITNVLAESAGLAQASPQILDAICENLGWDLGAIWRVDSAEDVLRCLTVSHSPLLPLDAFRQVSKGTTFARGVGLPGRVWKEGKPTWITDVVSDPNFPRATIAAQEGLHTAFGFPIKSGTDIVGVMEFFHHDIQKPDKELLHMFSSIGLQIGQFIQRTSTVS